MSKSHNGTYNGDTSEERGPKTTNKWVVNSTGHSQGQWTKKIIISQKKTEKKGKENKNLLECLVGKPFGAFSKEEKHNIDALLMVLIQKR